MVDIEAILSVPVEAGQWNCFITRYYIQDARWHISLGNVCMLEIFILSGYAFRLY
jgi:hypothetical protein